MNKKNHFNLIFILGLLTAIGPFSIDMYLPAFPAIAKGLNTDVAQVMLSLSSFFIGISVGQLVYGPMLERFGRKKPLYVGLVIYLLASIGCAFTESVNSLIAFRFLQALGSCAGMVTSRAMVRDLFEVKDSAKVFSSLMLVVAVSPIIAPTVGGYVTAALGWRYVFAALIIVDIAILTGVYFLLPESKQPDPNHSLKPKSVVQNFAGVIVHPQFYIYALTGAIAASGLYAYISGSPQVFIELFGVNEKQYGWIFAIIAVGIISTSQVNSFVLRKYSSEKIISVALIFQSIIGLTLAGIAFFNWSELYTTITLIFLYVGCQGFIFPNASALTLAAFGHNAGNASALMGAIQMGIGATASAVVSILQDHTALPMSGVMAFCSIAAFLIFMMGRKIVVQQPTLQEVEEEDVEMISGL
ncbi:MAG: multidrug effflux MFS transporter [Bacteroidetes bacterium]|nr:multidrug effflux MFS transporter [Bacteroidota bacterium]